MSANTTSLTCQQLGVCQSPVMPCERTCDLHNERADDPSQDDPLLHAEDCQCWLAKIVIGISCGLLGLIGGCWLLPRVWP